MALASNVLPQPGGPTSKIPRGMRPPIRVNRPRVLEEFDDFTDFLLSLTGARNVIKGRIRVVLFGVELSTRASEAHHAAGTSLIAHLAHEQQEDHEHEDERSHVQQEAVEEVTRFVGRGALVPRDVELEVLD